jgi:hypothetical protein
MKSLQCIPSSLRRRVATALPLALGFAAAIFATAPSSKAAPCVSCGNAIHISGDWCESRSLSCFGSSLPYWHGTTEWDRTECANGYIIANCTKNSGGCCNSTHSGPGCTNGSYCT